MKSTLKNIFLLATTIGLTAFAVFASPKAIFAQTTEEQRNQDLEQQLLLSLPDTTENPNFILTFTDPSGKGVNLSIDGKEPSKISNPYTLPTLGIGKHTLTFKFNDKQQTAQTLDRDLVVIPRAPQIKAPTVTDGILTLNGTGLAGSTIELFISNDVKAEGRETTVDNSGNWTFVSEKTYENGKYTIVALARKYGYSSKFSEAQIFDIGSPDDGKPTVITTTTQNSNPISFSFSSLTAENVVSSLTNNKDLLIVFAVILVLGLLLGLFFSRIFRNSETKKAEKLLKSVFLNDSSSISSSNDKNEKKDGKDEKKPRFSLIDKLEKARVADKINKEEAEKLVETTVGETKSADDTKVNPIFTPETLAVASSNETDYAATEKTEEKPVDEVATLEEAVEPIEPAEKESSNKQKKKDKKNAGKSKKNDEKTEIDSHTKDDTKSETETQTETVTDNTISKEDFLMKFKDFDPDNKQKTQDQAKDSKPARNIKITLTSDKSKAN